MNAKQQTLKDSVNFSGKGLHTGAPVNLTLKPAGIDFGIKFQRIDLEGEPIIEADADLVVDVSRGTTIEKDGARVSTIEHVLSALVGLQLDNVLIQLDGPEVPIMDGSAIAFVEGIEKIGIEEQNAFREYIELDHAIYYNDPDRAVEMAFLPLDDYRVTVMVDYNSDVLGSQHATLNEFADYKKEISPCRTFCFVHELEFLLNQGLIKGGDLDNAVVVVDRSVKQDDLDRLAKLFGKGDVKVKEDGCLNNTNLRFKNEPARHKLLDVMGDLALVGKPIKGQILAARPGHAANVELAKRIKKAYKGKRKTAPKYDPSEKPLLNASEIYKALPHQPPFQLVDKIIYLDHKSVVGVKNVSIAEPYFIGHFPQNPVMPGVLQLETMAQVGGIFVLNTVDDPENYWTYFLGVNECKFRKPVLPGDTLVIRCELLAPIKRGIALMKSEAFVGDTLVCETEILANITRKN